MGLLFFDIEIFDICFVYDEEVCFLVVVIKNCNGLYVCLVFWLVYILLIFNVDMLLEKNGKCVILESIN